MITQAEWKVAPKSVIPRWSISFSLTSSSAIAFLQSCDPDDSNVVKWKQRALLLAPCNCDLMAGIVLVTCMQCKCLFSGGKACAELRIAIRALTVSTVR